MALYALAAEVRAHVKDVDSDEAERQVWNDRLSDLGLRVADALVEMGELETASRHLDSLTDGDADEVAYRKALLRIRMGDIAGAQACVEKCQHEARRVSLSAVLKLADGDYSASADELAHLIDSDGNPAIVANNLAVCHLYTGRITDARSTLADLATKTAGFPALLFNLSTVYELCTERALDLKNNLASEMAEKKPAPDCGGWEKAAFEFKL